MLPPIRKRPIATALSLLMLVVLPAGSLTGCSGGASVAQVSGKVVTKDGSPLQGGVRTVRFEPTEDSPAAVRKGTAGQIQEDGSFQMYTRKPGDGVPLGKYAVTFAIWKGPMEPISLVDEKYTHSSTTPYTVTIDGDRDDLQFEIEMLGGADN